MEFLTSWRKKRGAWTKEKGKLIFTEEGLEGDYSASRWGLHQGSALKSRIVRNSPFIIHRGCGIWNRIRLATSRKRASHRCAVEPVSLLAAVGKAVPALSPATIGQQRADNERPLSRSCTHTLGSVTTSSPLPPPHERSSVITGNRANHARTAPCTTIPENRAGPPLTSFQSFLESLPASIEFYFPLAFSIFALSFLPSISHRCTPLSDLCIFQTSYR